MVDSNQGAGSGADADIFGAAAQSLATDLASESAPPAPTPAGGDTPAPSTDAGQPSAQAAPEAASAPPATAAAAPSPTNNIDPSTLDESAKAFLKQQGGWDGVSPVSLAQVQKALAQGLAYNNRLAELAKQPKTATSVPAPETETPVAQAQPAASPAAPKAEPPAQPEEPEPSPDQISVQVEQAIDTDPSCVRLVQQHVEIETELASLIGDSKTPGQIAQLSADLEFSKRALLLPEIKDNPLRQEEVQRQVDTLELKLERALTKRDRLEGNKEFISRQFDARANSIRTGISGQIAQRVATTRQAKEYHDKWPSSIERVLQANSVPAESTADVKAAIRSSFMLAVYNGELVKDLDGFMDKAAKAELARLDRYHRSKSADYGRQAQQRQETVVPPSTTPATPPPAQPTADDDDPNSIFEAARSGVYRELGLG